MDKTFNNKLGFENALIDIGIGKNNNFGHYFHFENAFNNTYCPLSLEQSESTEYVNNLFNRGDSRYEG